LVCPRRPTGQLPSAARARQPGPSAVAAAAAAAAATLERGGGGAEARGAGRRSSPRRPGRSIRARKPGPGGGCVPWSAAAVARRRSWGGGRRRHSSPRRPRCCTRVLQRHGPGGAGRGIGVQTAANGGASPQPTALPLPPSHHRQPYPTHLPTLPRDQPPSSAGFQDALLLQRRRISAQCYWTRTRYRSKTFDIEITSLILRY
jgi:hypothetical protein